MVFSKTAFVKGTRLADPISHPSTKAGPWPNPLGTLFVPRHYDEATHETEPQEPSTKTMTDAGKILMLFAVLLFIAGAILWILGRSGFHGLPGDIAYHSRNVRVYIPIVSCLVISLLLSALLWLWQWLIRR